MEHDNFIYTIEKFRTEDLSNLVHHAALHRFIALFGFVLTAKSQCVLFANAVCAGIAGHDNHGILEVHHTSLTIRQSAVLQNLEQHVEYIRMRLFNLVQQYNGIRFSAHPFGQLTAFFITDIARRRTDHSGYGMLLHVFGHIDANHAALVPEQCLAQRLAQLGFAHARGP